MDFDAAIKAHLELRRRNARLEPRLPLDRYRGAAPIDSAQPLDPEASRALEETQQSSPTWLAGRESEADANSGWAWQDG
jgi:hypothetical protein